MSSRCQCPFSGPADTLLGSHRDPISSEKGWLDFAVRELSRVAAGKARGQEAVWRSQCKPAWWDSVCRYPWKNPTANPKDSKDTLKTKFECLVRHLREKGQLPREIEQEVDLWEKGRVSEVFLLTSISSILGQASSLHCVLSDSCQKMEDNSISVDSSILDDLQRCLSVCVSKIEAIKSKQQKKRKADSSAANASCSGRKHPHDDSDSDDSSPRKRSKRSSPSPSPSSTSPSSSSSSSRSETDQSLPSSPFMPEQDKLHVMALLQKQLLQKRDIKSATATLLPAQGQGQPAQFKPRDVRCPRQQPQPSLTGGNVAVAPSPLTNPSAAVIDPLPVPETVEFTDFLNLDLVSGYQDETPSTEIDCDFFDRLLEETPPVQNEATVNIQPDPLLCQANPEQNFPKVTMAAAGRLVSGEEDMTIHDLDAALNYPDARVVKNPTEIASDSDYETCSPSSHRSSMDSDQYTYDDVDSPVDIEALLSAFQ